MSCLVCEGSGVLLNSVCPLCDGDASTFAKTDLVQSDVASAVSCVSPDHSPPTDILYLHDLAWTERYTYDEGHISYVFPPSGTTGANSVQLCLDKSIFHVQGGGQPADKGILTVKTDAEPLVLEVAGVKHFNGDRNSGADLRFEIG